MRRFSLLVALLVALQAPRVTADGCGAVITDDFRLNHDLVCAGDALIVAADGIKIDLNWHTISGSGGGTGIAVTGRSDVTIAGGVLRSFAVAMRVNAATGIVIRHNAFVDNLEAIDLQAGSVGNTVKANVFQNSSIRAVMLRSNSRDNDIKNNWFRDNRIGVLVFGGVDSELKDNLFTGSTIAGIRLNVIASGNLIKGNTLSGNASGVEFLVTATGTAAGNELKGNLFAANTCAVNGPTSNNTLQGNQFYANVADAC